MAKFVLIMLSPDLKRLLSYLKNYKVNVIFNFVFNFLFIVFSLFSIATIAPFLNLIFEKGKIEIPATEASFSISNIKEFASYKAAVILNYFPDKATALTYLCLVIVFVFLLKNIFRYVAF